MNYNNKYRAVIIGAGNIGAFYDTPHSSEILTHAHAYTQSKKIKLEACYDTDRTKARKVAAVWGIKYCDDLRAMMREIRPEIVSVCTPDETHAEVLDMIYRHKPKVVICEKPMTLNYKESVAIKARYRKAGILLVVNYSRRFDSSVKKLRADILRGLYGKIQSASGIYTKGVKHNGSHMLNQALYLFGNFRKAEILDSFSDYKSSDPTVSAFLSFDCCPRFFLSGANEANFTIFEMDILFEKGRVRILNGGLFFDVARSIKDPHFAGYTILGNSKRERTLNKSFSNLLNNVTDYLDGKKGVKKDLDRDLDDALETDRVTDMLSQNVLS